MRIGLAVLALTLACSKSAPAPTTSPDPSVANKTLGEANRKEIDRSELVHEVIDKMDRIYKDSALYLMETRRGSDGKVLPCRFPPSAEITPPLGSCCNGTRSTTGVCEPLASDWAADTWKELGFRVMEPQRYYYKYESSGEGASGKFTVTAYGDLDCDGVYSTFAREGFVDADTPPGECTMRGTAAFLKVNENE